MTRFEWFYICVEPLLPPLYREVRRRIRARCGADKNAARLLDAGGRKSHYTIGLPAQVTISELTRETDIQHQLDLGTTYPLIQHTLSRRSNVQEFVVDDMTRSQFPNESFEYVSAIEVLEHVKEDRRFLNEVHRVLKPGGTFIMTTPNGDFVENTNPDHVRHYTRHDLESLLQSFFTSVSVEYAIPMSGFYTRGQRSWTLRRPVRTCIGMLCNLVSNSLLCRTAVAHRSQGTMQLIAAGVKSKS